MLAFEAELARLTRSLIPAIWEALPQGPRKRPDHSVAHSEFPQLTPGSASDRPYRHLY